ncbi:MAG: hypothetical protein CVV13_02210 [Gammaproteobacteria bacterium HGW-Gammaproteobacteria-3]|jgi:cytochrome c5|nr:MAG: hypothetical protein CVV13_02210 [Gammaproteobacteria bacterium HGW-Gammaproteobacteria-3]
MTSNTLIHGLCLALMSISISACAPDNKTTGFWQEMRQQVAINEGKQRTGEEVYQYRCRGCHGKNTQGAPMPGDRYEWQRRSRQGMVVLMEHTLKGYKQTMPPRGGCPDCSDAELRRALDYMLAQDELQFSGKAP